MKHRLTFISIALLILFLPEYVRGGSELVRIDWADRNNAKPMKQGSIVADNVSVRTSQSLLLDNRSDDQQGHSLMLLEDPELTAGIYSLHLRVRSEIPQGRAAFEFILCGPSGGVLNFVTSPPLINGDSRWTDYLLDFNWTRQMGELNFLAVTAVLPPRSKIWIEPATVFRHQPNESLFRIRLATMWWRANQSLWLISGVCLFLLLNCGITWVLAQVGIARRFCILAVGTAVITSVLFLAIAGAAYWLRQPEFVARPLLLAAVPSLIITTLLARTTRKRFLRLSAKLDD